MKSISSLNQIYHFQNLVLCRGLCAHVTWNDKQSVGRIQGNSSGFQRYRRYSNCKQLQVRNSTQLFRKTENHTTQIRRTNEKSITLYQEFVRQNFEAIDVDYIITS